MASSLKEKLIEGLRISVIETIDLVNKMKNKIIATANVKKICLYLVEMMEITENPI